MKEKSKLYIILIILILLASFLFYLFETKYVNKENKTNNKLNIKEVKTSIQPTTNPIHSPSTNINPSPISSPRTITTQSPINPQNLNSVTNCNQDLDCGQKNFILNPFCENDKVMQYMVSPICNDPGRKDSYCSNSTTLEVRYDCPSFKNTCKDAQCVTCVIQCSGKQCGSNGCGGLCGICDPRKTCNSEGKCV